MTKTKSAWKLARIGQKLYEGLPVVDAEPGTRLEFTVTKETARKSRPHDPGLCAAALAASETFHTEVRVHLSRTYVKAEDGKRWIRYETPDAVGRELISFDRSKMFEAGTYYVRAPRESTRLGTRHGSTANGTGGAKRKPAKHVTAQVRKGAREYWSEEK